ncbi:MAG: glycosyltransferase family 4 protein [Cyanobacteria bacterium P01_F01_bin.150]
MVLSKFLSPRSRTGELIGSPSLLSIKRNIEDKNIARKHTYSKLRLLILNQFFPPDFAATGQLIEELAKQLVLQNLDVEVFTGQPGYAFQTESAPAKEKLNGVSIRRSRISHIWFQRIRGKAASGIIFCMRSFLYLLKCARKKDVLLVTTAPPFLPVIAYLIYCLVGLPYVCIIYDLYPDIATELGVINSDHWIVNLWNRLNRAIWCNAAQIVVLSDSMKKRVLENCPSLAPSRVSVIHSWADPDHIKPYPKQENRFAQKYNLVESFTVLYSGNIGRCHDVDTIVEAMQYLKDEPIQFVFIGGGAKQPSLEEQVDQLGLSRKVKFLPYQEKHNLPHSLTACDLSLVSVSEDMGALVAPSKLYSALAAGRPIAAICSAQSYLNSLLIKMGCGATFENGQGKKLADYILYLSRDRDFAEKLGSAGRDHMARHFTPQTIATQYADVLRNAVCYGAPVTPSSTPFPEVD